MSPKFLKETILPETNSLPLKIDPWKRRFRTWKPSFLGANMLVLGSVSNVQLAKDQQLVFFSDQQLAVC